MAPNTSLKRAREIKCQAQTFACTPLSSTVRCHQGNILPTFGVFAAIFDDDGRILCVRLNYGSRGWTTPGGRVEPSESPFDALAREVVEETGLEVEPGELLGVYGKPQDDDVVLSVRAQITGRRAWQPNDEIAEFGYFALDELPEPMSVAARARITDALEGRSGVLRVVDVPTSRPQRLRGDNP